MNGQAQRDRAETLERCATNWLGRSQFSGDAEFGGTLHELRIYNAALSAAQIQLTEQAGPDPSFF